MQKNILRNTTRVVLSLHSSGAEDRQFRQPISLANWMAENSKFSFGTRLVELNFYHVKKTDSQPLIKNASRTLVGQGFSLKMRLSTGLYGMQTQMVSSSPCSTLSRAYIASVSPQLAQSQEALWL